jgi:hypothetical protein
MVADLGSGDGTAHICEQHGAYVFRMDCARDEARNRLIESTSGPTFCIEPWEILAQGRETLSKLSNTTYATIIQQNHLSKDIRAWTGKPQFVNPVYETIEDSAEESDIVICSSGRSDYNDLLEKIKIWKQDNPTAIAPHYYEACTLLALGRWQQFLPVSEHYMFLDKSTSMSCVMNHYYFSMVQLMYLKKVVPSLQNITICLSAKPLMAEFWCLAGDVHYHLTKQFNVARDLYENAIFLGSRRLKSDRWPMDIAKYKSYPTKMIESCNKLIRSKSLYVV